MACPKCGWLHADYDCSTDTLPPTAQQQSVARNAFLNAIRILHSMEPSWLPRDHYDRFIDAPTEYLMRADEPTLARIWDEVQARQPERYKHV